MKIIKIDISKPDIFVIREACDVLLKGGLVVYPTDTCYGLGANAFDINAIRSCYNVKGRDNKIPTHVVVRDWGMAKRLCFVNSTAKILYDHFLPGPITLIFKKKKIVPDILTANLKTLGVRIPKNSVTKLLSSMLNFPYTTPSANRMNEQTPYSLSDLKKVLHIDKIDVILDAGKLPITPPSTIIDLSNFTPKVLRVGSIATSDIEKILHKKVKV